MEIVAVGPFVLSKTLGTGATGKVKLGFHRDSGFKVAIKIITKNALQSRPAMQQKLEREIAIMKFLDHPNVLRLYDVYDTPNYLFLVLEHVEGGELFDYLLSKGKLEDAEALRFFQQLVDGVSYCHSHMICHRDLKPENILLDANLCIKICDFGMAALMPKDALLATSCGSPHYASPEVITGRKYNGMEADVWSLGVILYALLVGKLPFDDQNMRKLLLKVKIGVFEMPAHLDKTAKDLLWRMMTVDPEKRAKLSEIQQHPWFLSNGGPENGSSGPLDVDNVVPFSSAEELDPEVVQTLTALWGDEQAVLSDLMADDSNLTKVFYRLIQNRFLRRQEEEDKATEVPATPEPQEPPSPGGSGKSFRDLARRSLSYFRPNSTSPSPAAVEGTDEASPATSPHSPIGGRISEGSDHPNMLSRRAASVPAGSFGRTERERETEAKTPEKGPNFMRRLSVTRLKSPQQGQSAGSSYLDSRLFTSSVAMDQRSEATSPGGGLTGASPRKSWFHFFSRTSQQMKPLSSRSEGPPLARAIMSPLSSDETWAKAQPVIEDMGCALRYSKQLRCLKASRIDMPGHEDCKFFLRMSNLATPRGSNSTYLHWEFRAGSMDEFLKMFEEFCGRAQGMFPFQLSEDTISIDSSSVADVGNSNE